MRQCWLTREWPAVIEGRERGRQLQQEENEAGSCSRKKPAVTAGRSRQLQQEETGSTAGRGRQYSRKRPAVKQEKAGSTAGKGRQLQQDE